MSRHYDILRFRAGLNQNREVFLLSCQAEVESFDHLDRLFPAFLGAAGRIPVVSRTATFQLGPLLHVMQRQARNAFEALAARQSHEAWSSLRLFLESALIMGKWLDDPHNAFIWASRHAGKAARREYQDAYGGGGLRSQSLPHSEMIRGALARLDDSFIHTNARYYAHPISLEHGKARGDSVEDESDQRAHVYAVLHLLWYVMQAVGQMLAAKGSGKQDLDVDLGKFEREFGPAAEAMARADDAHRAVLSNLGLWPHDVLR